MEMLQNQKATVVGIRVEMPQNVKTLNGTVARVGVHDPNVDAKTTKMTKTVITVMTVMTKTTKMIKTTKITNTKKMTKTAKTLKTYFQI